jgi:DNA mismatch repair protein MutS
VGTLSTDVVAREAMREAIDDVRDIERLAAKAAAGRSTPRELRALGDSLAALPAVASALHGVAEDGGRLGEILRSGTTAASWRRKSARRWWSGRR